MDTGLKQDVLNQLGVDEHHPVRTGEIAKRLGFRSDRLVREAITELVKDGLPIIVNGHKPYGAFLATKPEQAQAERAYLLKYVISMCIKMKWLKIAEKHLLHPEQLKLKI